MSNGLELRPITFKNACSFIDQHHRHHRRPQGWKFGTSAWSAGTLVGVIMVGRPVARGFDDGMTVEVTRCCTDGTKNAASLLYGAARRAAKALGYHRIITYLLAEEPGTTMRALGWNQVHTVKGRSWSCPSRPRTDTHPTVDKVLWESRP